MLKVFVEKLKPSLFQITTYFSDISELSEAWLSIFDQTKGFVAFHDKEANRPKAVFDRNDLIAEFAVVSGAGALENPDPRASHSTERKPMPIEMQTPVFVIKPMFFARAAGKVIGRLGERYIVNLHEPLDTEHGRQSGFVVDRDQLEVIPG